MTEHTHCWHSTNTKSMVQTNEAMGRKLLGFQTASNPVAFVTDLEANMNGFIDCMAYREGEFTTPLYLHPVKELTDEDFMQIMRNRWDIEDYKPEFIFQLKEFARAILRKAQEK